MTEEAESKSALTPPKPLTARWPRHLGDWLPSWPFEDFGWFSRGDEPMAGAPIKVEEFTDQDHIVIRAELPGVDPERDIDVTVDDGVLTIRAERREGRQDKTAEGYRSEFGTEASYARSDCPKAPGRTLSRRVPRRGARDPDAEAERRADQAADSGRARVSVESERGRTCTHK